MLEGDVENSYLAAEATEAGPLDQLLGQSITYRIAVGPPPKVVHDAEAAYEKGTEGIIFLQEIYNEKVTPP